MLIMWRALAAVAAVGASRAISLVTDARTAVSVTGARPDVAVHTSWPVLTTVSGGLIAGGGLVVALFGGSWSGMSSRYEAPQSAAPATRDDAALWSALDRGEDPTV
jgi:hypothetical protein